MTHLSALAMHHGVGLLAQTDLVTGSVNLANALKALFVALAILAAIALVISIVRESHGAWTPVFGAILLAAVILFFVTNPNILDGPIRATVNRFWG